MTDASPGPLDHTEPLEAELVALGRSLPPTPPRVDLADRVLLAIATPTDRGTTHRISPIRRLAARPRRLAAAIAAAVVLAVALVPPVRAAVLELLRIGGVTVREVPAPNESSAQVTIPTARTGTPIGATPLSLADAERITGVTVRTPATLGPPTDVALGHEGRVIELTWGDGANGVRMDVFDGTLSYGYLKSVWRAVTPTNVGGHEAVWFDGPHVVEWVDRSGATERTPPRVAGPTLVWVDRDASGREVTYRLEGPETLADAVRIATS